MRPVRQPSVHDNRAREQYVSSSLRPQGTCLGAHVGNRPVVDASAILHGYHTHMTEIAT